MQKRFMQAAASLVLFASIATPAFAHGNGGDKGDNGKHFGWFKSFEKIEARFGHKDDKHKNGKDDDKPASPTSGNVNSQCKTVATEAHATAMKNAQNAYDASMATVKAALKTANAAADAAKLTVMTSARTTFRTSDHGAAAQSVFVAAWLRATLDWRTATNAAKATFDTAKANADSVRLAAKLKADVDLKAALAACAPSTTPTPTPAPTADTAAPSAITNLLISAKTSASAMLEWIAPGDDGTIGTAASYDVRYSTAAISTDADFNAANQVTGEPAPAVAGTTQSMNVAGLSSNTSYWFAIKTKDDVGNISALSNVVNGTTLP